jgi:hypothetical protein
MATTTQKEYTHANVLFHNEDIILIDPFHENWDWEVLCVAGAGINGFIRGYVRAKWGAAAKIVSAKNLVDYSIEVDGSVAATIRTVTYDLAHAEQAAFCGCGVYADSSRPARDPDWNPLQENPMQAARWYHRKDEGKGD